MKWRPLPRAFYQPSAAEVAPALLGHWLLRRTEEGIWCGGVIVETEAYIENDPACHAYKGFTQRNRSMWGEPGLAYVYLIYGYHNCFNAVCRPAGVAEAVLVRAVEASVGLEELRARRSVLRDVQLTSGPGKLCAAMDVTKALDGVDLCRTDSPLVVAENPEWEQVRESAGPIVQTVRVGISQAAEWPLRFYLDGSAFVSKRVPRIKKWLGGSGGMRKGVGSGDAA